ncbi:N-acetylgalactosaminyltransferase 6-like [Scaptodrosophila lebanonensis]|uniref:Polypeptide N-acetylgalactosaminyltransferase n=1 Tax=Drosophila lebanonensis TaxID=7225 RepID=A0A6J2TDB9_DROLE|nr:N-acetylgalactosaminyltransferase 6-like [Scaptodrosophila lebanonensis]
MVERKSKVKCEDREYAGNLPRVSIIITFFNEYKSVLLRTLHSVVNRTSPELLKEIILVDDFSDTDFLDKPLNEYVAAHFTNVRILRMLKHSGRSHARMLGARSATAPVLVFMDSHIEVGDNWLPPLLEPIMLNNRTVMCPIIDRINEQTLRYQKVVGGRGAFDWNLNYSELPRLPEDMKYPSEPFKNPIMKGELFAIFSKFFWKLKGYDNGFNEYGGEQFELSFKIWMCDGEIYDAPCSRVAHIEANYRKEDDAESKPQKFILRNYKRVAEVWMGYYKKYLFQNNIKYSRISTGDLTKQKAVRSKCKSFEWYLDTVAFDTKKKYPPSLFKYAEGAIQNMGNSNFCVDTLSRQVRSTIGVSSCAENLASPHEQQFWSIGWTQDLRTSDDEICLDVPMRKINARVKLWKCHGQGGNQHWIYDIKTKLLRNGSHGKRCLEMLPHNMHLVVNKCNETKQYMKWIFGFTNRTALENMLT